ncbi:MAG: helix-turn-helix domain-containing protein [Lachnospiraceae bacterium]|nr:helix-turn-helix domain-containing protein [Lachnospiraceae bacterium]
MPKSNLCKPRDDPRKAEVLVAIESGLIRQDMTRKSLAKKIGMPYSTLTQRLRNPQDIRLEELWSILDTLKVSEDGRTKII